MKDKRGFTLIEILVVIGIFGVIIAFSMTINLSNFTINTFSAEQSKLISVLERARSHAMANMFESKYGFCYDTGDYIIFHDGICDKSLTDETVVANANIASHPSTIFPTKIVFNQLSGNTDSISDIVIHLTDGIKSTDIKINNEGVIKW